MSASGEKSSKVTLHCGPELFTMTLIPGYPVIGNVLSYFDITQYVYHLCRINPLL